jgi:type IV secretory pathway TraG/TraD family ATPase VirD4
MSLAPDRITYFGRTNHRNAGQVFGILQTDRRLHLLVVGKTGTGKSHLLKLIAEQDIASGIGFALFDPTGDLVRALKTNISEQRVKDLVFIDPTDFASRWRFNPFGGISPENLPLAAAGIVEVFKKLWSDDWGPRLEHLLRNVAYTLLETPGATFADIPDLLVDRSFRLAIARELSNPVVKSFWYDEFDKYTPAFRSTVIAPLQNKVGGLLTDPVLRRFFTEDGTSLDLGTLMDEGRIILVNLDKGRLGEGPAMLLGSLLLSHIGLAGLARGVRPEIERSDFAVLLDEFQLFTTQSLANMLSELRKFRVSIVLATQYLGSIDRLIREAVFGNVGTIISFRVGAKDAAVLVREFGPPLSPEDFTSLPKYQIYVRLLVNGEPSRSFSAETLSSLDPPTRPASH